MRTALSFLGAFALGGLLAWVVVGCLALLVSGCATGCCVERDVVDVQTPYGADCYRDCLKIPYGDRHMECVRYCPGVVVSRRCR